ncbi:MAG: hypothetical protein WA838_19415 [Xanthobacteraceae bacterium]
MVCEKTMATQATDVPTPSASFTDLKMPNRFRRQCQFAIDIAGGQRLPQQSIDHGQSVLTPRDPLQTAGSDALATIMRCQYLRSCHPERKLN